MGLLGRAHRGGARRRSPGLVNAGRDDVAVTTSLSAGVSALASAIDFTERPKVVISDYEFPTIGQIWHAQQLRGAEVHVVPPERVDEAIDERTAIVSVTAVCYRNGARLPVEEIARVAHERGALCLLDAYQAAGSYPLDVTELGVDALAAGVLKYLLGSAGLAFLWTRPGLAGELTPTDTGWFADRDIFEMAHTRYAPAPNARRWQSGTPPVPAIYAGIAGIELMREIGIAETREHVNALNERLIAGVDELGGTVVTPRERRAARRARLHPLDRRARRSSRRSARTGSSPPSATRTCASRPTPTTRRTTSTPSSRASPSHRHLLRRPGTTGPCACTGHPWTCHVTMPAPRLEACPAPCIRAGRIRHFIKPPRCFSARSHTPGRRPSPRRSSSSQPTTARGRSRAARR